MSVDDDEVAEVKTLWRQGIHMDVGARYLAALQKLGLDPECLFWAEDEAIGHPVLVVVTEQFDRVGPLELSRTLFKAYDHAGTPREINPFILRLHSPHQVIIRNMEASKMGEFLSKPLLFPSHNMPEVVFIQAAELKFQHGWVYKWNIPAKKLSTIDLRRHWRRFTENVDRLAA